MAPDHFAERPLQTLDRQLADDFVRCREVVEGAVGVQLVKEPEPRLREGQRCLRAVPRRRNPVGRGLRSLAEPALEAYPLLQGQAGYLAADLTHAGSPYPPPHVQSAASSPSRYQRSRSSSNNRFRSSSS